MRKILFVFSLLLCNLFVLAQHPPFWDDIQNFKRQDAAKPPAKHAILFVGSSSFTNWIDVQNYFPDHTIINRGFGGSALPDVIRYADDVIFHYEPKQIVIYCGENDLVMADTVSGKTVYKRFVQLFEMIRKKMPDVPVAFISLKPSPSRWNLRKKMTTANSLIKTYLAKKKKTAFINVYPKMLGKDGKPKREIFLEDELHMNNLGYEIWQKAIQPVLIKE